MDTWSNEWFFRFHGTKWIAPHDHQNPDNNNVKPSKPGDEMMEIVPCRSTMPCSYFAGFVHGQVALLSMFGLHSTIWSHLLNQYHVNQRSLSKSRRSRTMNTHTAPSEHLLSWILWCLSLWAIQQRDYIYTGCGQLDMLELFLNFL